MWPNTQADFISFKSKVFLSILKYRAVLSVSQPTCGDLVEPSRLLAVHIFNRLTMKKGSLLRNL